MEGVATKERKEFPLKVARKNQSVDSWPFYGNQLLADDVELTRKQPKTESRTTEKPTPLKRFGVREVWWGGLGGSNVACSRKRNLQINVSSCENPCPAKRNSEAKNGLGIPGSSSKVALKVGSLLGVA